MNAIETQGLTHRFAHGETVLRDVALEVPAGSIYGFLGPNGAGKTTTLRLILGLLRVQSGRIQILGKSIARDRVGILAAVGSSVESPSLYSHLTAAENLEVWRLIYQSPTNRISEVLRLVGLADTGRKRSGEFSLGMKQRLSIAVALLHEPSLLILDEPTNGLDPHGMIEIRDLLLRLNRERGITIVVSSHLLSEIQRLVTHVGIINRGSLLFQGALASLVAKQAESSFVTVDTSDNERALDVLHAAGVPPSRQDGKIRLPSLGPAELGRINRALVMDGLSVHEITSREGSLESIFMDLIGN
ncbi:MAG: ABC transporter ATP-binding protein [Vicinamibacteria bacterium]